MRRRQHGKQYSGTSRSLDVDEAVYLILLKFKGTLARELDLVSCLAFSGNRMRVSLASESR